MPDLAGLATNIGYNNRMVSLAIQAGGGSRRMGRDKALMPFHGRTLIERVVERLRSAADEVFVASNKPVEHAFLGLPVFSDEVPGRGSLEGLRTALVHASHPIVAVVACDMPFASAALLREECRLLMEGGHDLVIPRTAEGLEPFHAVYRKQTCLPAVERALEAGILKAAGWLAGLDVRTIGGDELAAYDPHGIVFMNLNTPEDFKRAEAIVAGRDER